MWLPNKDRVYTVKSGYYIARVLYREMNGMKESSGVRNRGLTWPRLWKLHLPSKIKCSGGGLARIFCPRRKTWLVDESLRDMRALQARNRDNATHSVGLWGGSGCVGWQSGMYTKVCGRPNYFIQLFEDMTDKLAVEEHELFLVQCWVIWSQRNSILHGGIL